MHVIYKFPLDFPEDEQWVTMQAGAEILHVAWQMLDNGRQLMTWARVDLEAPTTERRILMRGTGHNIGNVPHIATIFDGPFVWHFFDGGED